MSSPAGRAALVGGGVVALLTLGSGPAASPSHAQSPGYSVTSGTFTATHLGPHHDTSCPIVYDLYVPDPPPPPHGAPAILFTNGFGGSKADGAPLARFFAPRGYVVLAYSGLGFGGSGCQIELDSPEWDGAAASQLIDFLGTLPEVKLDGPDDPRVGMFGGSYGGAIQLVTASVTPKLDTIVPEITWNDLAYSLAPNNDSPSLTWTDDPPGVPKVEWTNLFFALGLTQPLQHLSTGTLLPTTLAGCPGFDSQICADQAQALATGAPTPETVALLRHASMVDYGGHVRIPTLLLQGEGDTLFDIDEAVATRAQILANGAYAKLVLHSWGHSFGGYPGDNTRFADPAHPTYEERLVERWFDHYLKDLPVDTGPPVEYFRDWVEYDPSSPAGAGPAYAAAPTWPVGTSQTFALSGTGDLVPLGALSAAGSHSVASAEIAAGSQSLVSVPGGGSYSETAAFQYSMQPFESIPASDPPGTYAAWSTGPLSGDVDVVGIPTLTFHLAVAAPSVPGQPGTDPVLFGKLYDVAPDGSQSLVFPRLVAPVRVADPTRPVTMTLPGLVHRFAAGHRLRLVLAATDDAYLNSRIPNVYTVSTGPDSPSLLTLPVVASTPGGSSVGNVAGSSGVGPSVEATPNTAASSGPLSGAGTVAAATGLGLGVLGRRRRARS